MAEKKESIWQFYFRARWQTALTTLFLIMAVYLSLFYVGNIWNALEFAFYTFVTSPEMLGVNFALWGVVFEVATVIPFLASWYAILLLPKIWDSTYRISQKTFITVLMIVLVPMVIIITDAAARYALDTPVLREFVNVHNIIN